MDKDLSILFLASWYPNRIEPQDGNFVQRHAVAVAHYCQVSCLHVLSTEDSTSFTIEKRWHEGVFEVTVYYPKSPKILPFLKLQRYKKAHNLGFQAILKERTKVDLVHLNVHYPAGIFAQLLKRKYKIPYIITEHWTAFLDSNPNGFSAFQKYVIHHTSRQASAICPVSIDLANALKKHGIKGHYKVIPNVVDTDLFQIQQEESTNKLVKILHVSTLYDPHKNIRGILNTVHKLSQMRRDFIVHLVGNGYVEQHRSYAQQLGIPESVLRIQGETPNEEVAKMMQEQDLFLLFSHYENLPCVIIEALASGMPVIASDVGGISEMIDKSNGLLVKAGDEEQLLKTLHQMLDQLPDYSPKDIREAAVQRYSYQQVGRQFLEIYHEVIN
ncbi:MAG: glycosyltransferase [Bacteroidota bacterium]